LGDILTQWQRIQPMKLPKILPNPTTLQRKLQKSRGADPFLGVQNTPKIRILGFYFIFM